MTTPLTRFLSPKSIAFIGGHECEVAIERTRALGFEGQIWAVHPRREKLGGVACIKSVEEIDGAPDAAFIAVKRELTIGIVRHLNKIGCGGAVIYASGFSEAGDIGKGLQRQLLEAGRGMPLMGPNCYASSMPWRMRLYGPTSRASNPWSAASPSSRNPAISRATSP
jgi:acyl-CoA synthetase (NDP forming)